jgi:preprotein translocase subunit SecG
MAAVVLTIHLLLAFALIVVVLLQRSEGGGLGIGGGGGVMTGRGAATALSKLTWALGVAFVVTSLSLTIIAARDAGVGSVMDAIDPNDQPEDAVPATAPPQLGEDLLPPDSSEDAPATPPSADGPATPPPAN